VGRSEPRRSISRYSWIGDGFRAILDNRLHSPALRRHSRISSLRFWSMARSVSQAGTRPVSQSPTRLNRSAAVITPILLPSSVWICSTRDSEYSADDIRDELRGEAERGRSAGWRRERGLARFLARRAAQWLSAFQSRRSDRQATRAYGRMTKLASTSSSCDCGPSMRASSVTTLTMYLLQPFVRR